MSTRFTCPLEVLICSLFTSCIAVAALSRHVERIACTLLALDALPTTGYLCASACAFVHCLTGSFIRLMLAWSAPAMADQEAEGERRTMHAPAHTASQKLSAASGATSEGDQ